MKIIKTLILVIAVTGLFSGAALAQLPAAPPLKLGYVNSSKILKELPEAIEAQRRLEAFGKRVQDSLETLSKQYEAKVKEYQQKQGLMTETAKQAAQQDILALEQRAMDLRERNLGREGEYAHMQERLLEPILEKVKKQIEEVAKEEKLTFVFDRTETVQILLYGHPSYDYTFRVIDRLKRK